MEFILVLLGFIGSSLGNDCSNSCVKGPRTCAETEYRSIDGSCNNLKSPTWGMANSSYGRLLPPNYGDGISSFPVAKSGKPLPNARRLSVMFYPEKPIEDKSFTLNAMQFGQIITHDMSLTFIVDGGLCCTADMQPLDPVEVPSECIPISIPKDDPDYSKFNATCGMFYSTVTDKYKNCSKKDCPAEQLSQVTHFLDLSNVYGTNDLLSKRLRELEGGRLRMDKINGQDWPYHLINITSIDCLPVNRYGPCEYASDRRVNQNTQLTVLQVILSREHNNIAAKLAKVNPHWNDETLYQEARKINIASIQYISYYEWLPTVLGREHLLKNKIIYDTDDFVDDYDENVNPSVLNEHAQAAFRFFHTQVAGRLNLVAENRENNNQLRLSDWYFRPEIIYPEDNFDDLSRGLSTQPEMGNDRYHTKETTLFLFKAGGIGVDLKSLDIQRNRNHGLAPYNDVREYCHLKRAKDFEDLVEISDDMRQKLKEMYESVDDIDLTVGGSLEGLIPGALAGPTFHYIMLKQFLITRTGDRFWFENSGKTGFTRSQLNEIRKSRISLLMCKTGRIKRMQERGFLLVSKDNPLVPCDSFPRLNFSMWKENK